MSNDIIVQALKLEYSKNPRFNRKEFAVKNGFDYNLVIKLGLKHGIRREKYKADFDFFEVIDSEQKAYWLGFLYADGCMTKTGGVNLLLSRNDRSHLEKYKADLKIENPIEDRSQKTKSNKTGVQHSSKIRICDKKLYSDLLKLGCVQNKTFKLLFPREDQVPKYLVKHFIRGYFDGDGSVWETSDKKGKYKNLQCGMTSTNDMISNIKNILLAQGLSSVEVQPHPNSSGICILRIRRNNDVIRFYEFLYTDAIIFLDRKKEKFDSFGLRALTYADDHIKSIISTQFKSKPFSSKDLLPLVKFYKSTVQASLKRLFNNGFIKKLTKEDRFLRYEYNQN